jgi:hypothetical protein
MNRYEKIFYAATLTLLGGLIFIVVTLLGYAQTMLEQM